MKIKGEVYSLRKINNSTSEVKQGNNLIPGNSTLNAITTGKLDNKIKKRVIKSKTVKVNH